MVFTAQLWARQGWWNFTVPWNWLWSSMHGTKWYFQHESTLDSINISDRHVKFISFPSHLSKAASKLRISDEELYHRFVQLASYIVSLPVKQLSGWQLPKSLSWIFAENRSQSNTGLICCICIASLAGHAHSVKPGPWEAFWMLTYSIKCIKMLSFCNMCPYPSISSR